jgi:hypothetical protein
MEEVIHGLGARVRAGILLPLSAEAFAFRRWLEQQDEDTLLDLAPPQSPHHGPWSWQLKWDFLEVDPLAIYLAHGVPGADLWMTPMYEVRDLYMIWRSGGSNEDARLDSRDAEQL